MYAVLHDRDRPTLDKVKIVRYAWKEQALRWPNKEQELVDWLCVALNPANRKRSTPEDLAKLWKCLRDILHTSKCHKKTASGQMLQLKPATMQLMVTDLENHAHQRTTSCVDHGLLTDCCLVTLTSPVHGHTWSSRQDVLLQLLSSCLHLCVQLVEKSQLTPQLLQLLESCEKRYATRYQQTANPQQVFQQVSQKLLVPAARLLKVSSVYRGELEEQLRQTAEGVMDTVTRALVQKQLLSNYELFLKLKVTDTDIESHPAKFLESCFQTMGQDFASGAAVTSGMIDVLPSLFSTFVKSYRGNAVCFQFCQFLVELVGILPAKPSSTSAETKPKNSLPCSQQLSLLTTLLRLVVSEDVYDLADDHLHSDHQLSWLRRVYAWVGGLAPEERPREWYSAQQLLLTLNHATLETGITGALRNVWIDAGQLPSENAAAQTQLLCDIVQLYTRLRQLPKLVSRLSEALRSGAIKDRVTWGRELQHSFAESLVSQPPTVIVEIWENLLAEITTHYIGASPCVPALEVVLRLLTLTLTQSRLSDYDTTHQVAAQVAGLMARTSADVLGPLVGQLNKLPAQTAAVLQLAHSWGQLHLTLSQFSPHYTSCSESPATQGAMSPSLHAYVPEKLWSQLELKMGQGKDAAASFIRLQLAVQNLRWTFTRSAVDDDQAREAVSSLLHKMALVLTKTDPAAAWDGQALSITERTMPVAVWQEMCQTLPVIEKYLSENQRQLYAKHFMARFRNHNGGSSSGGVTSYSVTQDFIQSGALWELNDIMSAILKEVWSDIADVHAGTGTEKQSSPKKKRKSLQADKKTKSADSLRELIIMDAKDPNSLQQMCNKIMKKLEKEENSTIGEDSSSKITDLLKILSQLPLEYMSPSNQDMCLLATLSLLPWTPGSLATSHTFMDTVLSLLHTLFCSLDSKRAILEHLMLHRVLGWIRETLTTVELPSTVADSCLQLYTAVLGQASWGTEQLGGVHAHSQQIVSSISKDHCDVQNLQLLLVILKHVTKVQSKRYVPAAILSAIRPLYALLSECVHSTIPECLRHDSETVRALALRLYSVMMAYEGRHGDMEGLLRHVTQVMDVCMEDLHNYKNTELLQGCLAFVSTACKYRTTQQAAAAELETGDGNERTDDGDKSQEDESKSSSSDEEGTDNEESTDQPMESDSKSYPEIPDFEAFMTQCWRHLVSLLHTSHSDSLTIDDARLSAAVRQEVERTLSHLVAAASTDQFVAWIHQLLDNVSVDACLTHPQRAVDSLCVWRLLLEADVPYTLRRGLGLAAQKLLLQLQQLLSEVSARWHPHYGPLVEAAVTIQTALVVWSKGALPPQTIALTLHTPATLPLRDLDPATFPPVFCACVRLLREVLTREASVVCAGRVPACTLGVRRLVDALVWSARQTAECASERELVACGQEMEKLLTLLVSHKKYFSKVAAHIVAEYTSAAQRSTLRPTVRRAVVPGVYSVMGMCDEHAVALLHVTLPAGVRDVFKGLYDEYNKYHRYKRRV